MNILKTNVSLIIISLLMSIFTTACQKENITKPGNLVPLTVDENSALPAIEINGTRLHAYAIGDENNPLIITLHGGPGGDHLELKQFATLADSGYRVVFWDQRGSGLSRRHNPEIYNEAIYLEDLVQLIDYYKTTPNQEVILLGHSWGAMYATMFINAYPNSIDGMIISEPGGLIEADMLEYVGKTQAISLTAEWSNDLVWMEQIMSPSKKWFSEEDHELFDYQYLLSAGVVFQQTFADEKAGGQYPVNRFGAIASVYLPRSAPGFDWTENLDQHSDKILFFYSELNPGYPESHMEKVTTPYANIDIHRVDGVGHELMVEGFDTVLPIISNYLKQR